MIYQMGESILDGYDVFDVVRIRSYAVAGARRFSGSNPDGTHIYLSCAVIYLEWRMTLAVRRNISVVFL